MRAARVFAAVDSHTEGMPTRVITGGLGSLPGETMRERRLYFERHLDAELVGEIPSIVAIKECSGDARRIAELVSRCPNTSVLVGGDNWALEGFCAGAAGWVSGVANVFPAECVKLWELCQLGHVEPARELYQALLPLGRLDMTPKLVQYFKAALDELSLGGGPCRPPRLSLTEAEREILRDAVAQGARSRHGEGETARVAVGQDA